ncbi:integrase core domain, partial [Paramuricea clavata]
MSTEIRNWCKECTSCQSNKVGKHTKTPLHQLDIPSERFACIHVDLVGPIHPENKGHNMLFTIIDHFTGFMAAYPLRKSGEAASSISCAKKLVDWIALFGHPDTVISDRGPQFVSRIWDEVANILGFKKKLTTAYHPQTNGK